MSLTKDTILYDLLDNKIVVSVVRNDGFFDAIAYRTVKVSYNGGKNVEINEVKEEETFRISNIGCDLFYNTEDKSKGKVLACFKEYEWNKINIIEYYTAKDKAELAQILKNAPSEVILNERDRKNLIKGYIDFKYSEKEEKEFYKKYAGKYFARMDFDIEFFKRNKEYLWKNHYYEKIYVGKRGSYYDDKNNIVIVDWRSPIGGFVNDNKNRAYNIGEDLDPLYNYNYELLLKRRFSSEGDFKNVWIADSGFYNDGDMDPFLLDVLTRLRREGNDKAVDIIETIQKEQNDIVRLDNNSFYVQGCAGSGKTMVLLHRLSYLSYNDKKFDSSKVKIITPNENIIIQLRDLSAQLEISKIEQLTIENYYINLIKEYSESLYNTLTNKHSNVFGKDTKKYVIKSENILDKDFLEYVYSDKFKEILDKRYNTYFENLFLPISSFLKTPNNYDLKSLNNLSKEVYLYIKKNDENIHEIENVKIELLKNNEDIRNAEQNVKSFKLENKHIFDKLKEVDSLNNLINVIEEITSINNNISILQLDKDKINKKLKEVDSFDLKVDIDSKYQKVEVDNLKSLKKTIDTYKNTLNELKLTIDNCQNLSNLILQENVKNDDEYQALLTNYNSISKINLFKRLKIKSEYESIRKKIESNNKMLDENKENIAKLNNERNDVTKSFDNYLVNAYFYLEELRESLQKQMSLLNKEESDLRNRKDVLEKQYTLENIDIVTKRKKCEQQIKEILKENSAKQKELQLLENELIKLTKAREKKENKLKSLGFLSGNEEKEFSKLSNKLLVKEDKKYENKLKLTGNLILDEILTPELNYLYEKYGVVENNSIFKYKLYLMLYILVKLRGEKSLSNLICIDEAQDITLNEYRVIKSVNKDAIFNLYGDTNQLLYKGRGLESWSSLSSIGYELQGFKLNRNYRNVANITRYCNKNLIGLEMIEMGVVGDKVNEINLESIYEQLNKIKIVIVKNKDVLKYLKLNENDYHFIEHKNQSIEENKINIFTVEMTKGMEFSEVIVVDKDMIRREKYIAYTRALNKLVICKI